MEQSYIRIVVKVKALFPHSGRKPPLGEWEDGSILYLPIQGFYPCLLLPRSPLTALKVGREDKKVLHDWHQCHFSLVSSGLCRDLKNFFFCHGHLLFGDYPWRLTCLATLTIAPLTSTNWSCSTPSQLLHLMV